MGAYFLQCRGFAKPRNVSVFPRFRLAAPRMVGIGDAGDILVGEFAPRPVHQTPELAGVDEQRLAPTVPPPLAGVLVAGEEPQTGGNLRRVEELPR